MPKDQRDYQLAETKAKYAAQVAEAKARYNAEKVSHKKLVP